jgi:hypothetical protein
MLPLHRGNIGAAAYRRAVGSDTTVDVAAGVSSIILPLCLRMILVLVLLVPIIAGVPSTTSAAAASAESAIIIPTSTSAAVPLTTWMTVMLLEIRIGVVMLVGVSEVKMLHHGIGLGRGRAFVRPHATRRSDCQLT